MIIFNFAAIYFLTLISTQAIQDMAHMTHIHQLKYYMYNLVEINNDMTVAKKKCSH